MHQTAARCVTIVFSLLLASPVLAQGAGKQSAPVTNVEDLRGGAEWTLGNEKLWKGNHWGGGYIDPGSSANTKALDQIFDHFTKICAGRSVNRCKVDWGLDKYWYDAVQLKYEDGVTVTFGVDVQVVEISMTPPSFQQAKALTSRIQADVFDGLRDAFGLVPNPLYGGGHFSLDFRMFDADPMLFLNFFTDFANHPELAREPGEDATHLSDMTQECQEAYARIVEDFRKEVASGHITSTTTDLAKRIRKEVYVKWGQAQGFTDKDDIEWATKNTAINLEAVVDLRKANRKRRIEDRSVQPQKSYTAWLQEWNLKIARIEMLKKAGTVIEYKRPGVPDDAQRTALFQAYAMETLGNTRDIDQILPQGPRPGVDLSKLQEKVRAYINNPCPKLGKRASNNMPQLGSSHL